MFTYIIKMSKYKLIYPSHSLIKIINLAKLSSINHIRHYKIKSSIETYKPVVSYLSYYHYTPPFQRLITSTGEYKWAREGRAKFPRINSLARWREFQ